MNPTEKPNPVELLAGIRTSHNEMRELLNDIATASDNHFKQINDLFSGGSFFILPHEERLKMREAIDCFALFASDLRKTTAIVETMEAAFVACPTLFPLLEQWERAARHSQTLNNDGTIDAYPED